MLMDFPHDKNEIAKFLGERVEDLKRLHLGGFLADAPRKKIFEGNECLLIREDGSEERIGFYETESNIKFNIAQVEHSKLFDYLILLQVKLNEMAQDIATQESRVFLK
jgi:hypothetical protein